VSGLDLGAAAGHAARANLTDSGNAERFAQQHREWARYCWAWRSWLLWTGTHWRRDEGDGALRLAKAVAKNIYLEVEHAPSPAERERIAKWAIATESEKRLRAMLALAQAEPAIPVRPEELDVDPWALNVQNGTLDTRTSVLRAHRREDLISRCLPVMYDPAATCPLWRATLERILDGHADLIRYFQKAIGYSCTGDTTEQVLFVLWGAGANGKTTILSTAATLLGDYALSTRPETFMVKNGDGIPNDVAQLKGRRLVIAVEAEAGQRLAEGLVKSMTGGGDTLTARFMRAEFFQFTPTFKIFLATNHKPAIRGTDHAIWRRIRLLPFTVTIPDGEQDRQLPEKLKAELPGILAWAIEGARRWHAEGLGVPDVVRVATEVYRADMDILGDFLRDRCVLEADAQVAAGELFQAYESWSHSAGEKALSGRTFGLRLKDRGFVPIRIGVESSQGWTGLRLRTLLDSDPASTDASAHRTHPDATSRISEPRGRGGELTGNKRPDASGTVDASGTAQEELPKWVTDPTETPHEKGLPW
jgi:putative DNA primase/helicase